MSTSFLFQNALQNKFCFPIYVHPVLLLPLIIIHRVFDALFDAHCGSYHWRQQDSHHFRRAMDHSTEVIIDESEDVPFKSKSIQFSNKEPIIGLFMEYTPLSYDIITMLIDEYYYDPEFEEFLKEKDTERKYKTFQGIFDYYTILTFIFHLSSFMIILWINLEWMIATDCSGWIAVQSLCINMVTMHPASKLGNVWIIIACPTDYGVETNRVALFLKLLIFMGIPYIGGVILYLVPSVFYYIPIWIGVCCIICIHCIAEERCGAFLYWIYRTHGSDAHNWIYNKICYAIIIPILSLLSASMMYFLVISMYDSMSCVYSGEIRGSERWYLCLGESFKSPYCPSTNVLNMDLSDWRCYILLVSWLLF